MPSMSAKSIHWNEGGELGFGLLMVPFKMLPKAASKCQRSLDI